MASLPLIIIVLSVLAMAMLLLPLAGRQGEAKAGGDRNDHDIDIYKDQLKEIDQDLQRGCLAQDQAEAAKIEIQRRLLAAAARETKKDALDALQGHGYNRAVMAVLALVLPLLAVFTYLALGSPNLKDYPLAERTGGENLAVSRQDQEMVAKLEDRLRQQPNDVKGWLLLGHSYMAMEQFQDAARAYRKAIAAGNQQKDSEFEARRGEIELNYAEALTFASNQEIPKEALSIFKRIRKAEPLSPKPRYYIGLHLARSGDYREAMQEWTDLVAIGGKDAPWREMVQTQIGNAAKALKIAPGAVKPSAEALELASAKAAKSHPSVPPGISREEMESIAKMTKEEREAFIRSMVESLAAGMEKTPRDISGWRRLAQGYLAIGEEEKAKQAIARAEALAAEALAAEVLAKESK